MTRDKDTFKSIKDIAVIIQYLYKDENNFIVVNNGLADLEIRMTNKFHFSCINRNFPDLDPMNFDEQMTVHYMMQIVECLKSAPSKSVHGVSRFEEIKADVAASLIL